MNTSQMQLSLSELASLVSSTGLLFIGLGLLVTVLLIDLPAQMLQAKMLQSAAESENAERKTDKAQALATFIKAAQVIIAFIVAKYAYMQWMV